jgi:hypothetical protein
MKKIIFLFLIPVIFAGSTFAQKVKPKVVALPADITAWNGEDSDKILDNTVIKIRLQRLLGAKNYASFRESFETLTPIEKNGNILFSSGCLIHACTHLESAIAIDLANQTIHAAIYRDDQKTKYFNERGSKTPKSIANWANRLKSFKNKKVT